METKIAQAVDQAKDKVQGMVEEGKDRVEHAKDKVQGMYDQAKDKVRDVASDIKAEADQAKVGQDYESLKADFQSLKGDFGKLVESLKATAASKASEVGVDLKGSANELSRKAADTMSQVKEKTGDLTQDIETRVKDRPLMSVLVAFGAGLVLSRMLSR